MAAKAKSGKPLALTVCVLALIGLAALLSQNCGPEELQPAKIARPAICPKDSTPLPAPWALTASGPAAEKRAHVYVDHSLSMAGFGAPAPGTPLHDVGAKLRQILFEIQVPQLYGAGFGTEVGPLEPINSPLAPIETNPTLQNTCLRAPFETELAPPADPTALPTPAVLIVLTDGVASAEATNACGAPCTAGSDLTCVAEQVRSYIAAGHALVVVGLRLPFQGRYWSEKCPGTQFDAPRSQRRPLYVWIGSNDAARARTIANGLLAWAKSDESGIGEANAIGFELWPGTWNGPRVAFSNPPSPDPYDPLQAQPQCSDQMSLNGFPTPHEVELIAPAGAGLPAEWAGRVPGLSADRDAEATDGRRPLTPLLTASVRSLVIHGDADGAYGEVSPTGADVCFSVKGNFAVGSLWSARVDTAFLDDWTTTNDCKPENLDRTFNLDNLWAQSAARLANDLENGDSATKTEPFRNTLLCATAR